MTEEERRQRLIAMGLDPEKYTYQTAEEKAYEETTALGAVGTGFMSSIGPTIGGVVAAAAPLALMSGPLGWGALGLSAVSGLAGAYLGGKGQEAAEDAALDDAEQQALALQRQAANEKYPWLTFAGQAAPSMAFFRPSPTVLKNIFGAVKNAPLGTQTALQRYALGNVAIGGGLEAGVDLGVQAMSGEDINWGRVAGAGALGGLLTEPTRVFGKVGATISRSGLKAKPWLEERGMTRPLTEVEAAKYALAKGEEHGKAVEKNRRETDKAVIEYSVTKDARKLLKKSDFPTRDELLVAEKQADSDIKSTKKTAENAASEYAIVKEQSEKILKANPLAHEVRQIRAKTQKLQKAAEDTQAQHTEALETRAALKKQIADLAAKTARARERLEDSDKRNRNRADIPKGPKPTDDDYFKSVQGLMAKQGMTMNEAVIDLEGRNKKGTFKIKGEYDIQAHAVTLNTLRADDTPWHEYLHGIIQMLKRSPNPKHQRLVEYIENVIFKDDPTYKKKLADGESLAERTAWTEEHIIQRGGKLLEKRMSNPPEGFMGGLKKWFSDWRLERDAATGFAPKYTDKKSVDADDLLDRMAKWMAMRGERAPALQPKQIDALLADLGVKSPYDNFGPVLGGSRYARDVPQPDEAPDEMRSRVGNIIRRTLAGTQNTSISKQHIKDLIAAAENKGKISAEDIKWNSQLLDSFYSYESKKIPREKVEELLSELEYTVTTLENRSDFPKPPLTAEERAGIAPTYIHKRSIIDTEVSIGNPAIAGELAMHRIKLVVDPERRKAGLPFIKPVVEKLGDAYKYMTEAEAVEYATDRLNEKRAEYGKIDPPYEGLSALPGDNYKIRTLRMPDKYTSPEFFDSPHEDFGAGKNTVGWVRSNRQQLVSDGTSSKHIIEAQSPLHQKGKALGYGTDKGETERHDLLHMQSYLTTTLSREDQAFSSFTLKPFKDASNAKYGPLFELPEQVRVLQREIDVEARALGKRMEEIKKAHDNASDSAKWAGIEEWTAKDKLKKQLTSTVLADITAVHNSRIRNKLIKDPEFTYGGYKYKYDEAADVLEQTPYERRYTEADLDVALNQGTGNKLIKDHHLIMPPKDLRGSPVETTWKRDWGKVHVEDFHSQQAFNNATRKDVIAAWLKKETSDPMVEDRTMPYYVGPTQLGISMEHTFRSEGPSFEAVLKPAHLDKGKAIPDVPLKGKKYVSALARDTVMSAVHDGDDSVTWPSTVDEINATELWGDGFHKAASGEVSAVYNLYVHGKLQSPDGRETHTFSGDGTGKQSLLDDAFEKIYKDFKDEGAEIWSEDRVRVEERFDDAYSSDYVFRKIETIEIHRFKIPPKMRDMLLREGGIESAKYQRVNAEELVGALKVVAMHDTSVQYSKRVRTKMMERIKAGEYSVEQGQKALVRFASKPFPSEMSGEEIAQVVNGLEMYHGTTLKNKPNVLREGFKGEELSPSSRMGRGIYMTNNKDFAATYGEGAMSAKDFSEHIISIRTNFKKLFSLDKTYSADDAEKFVDSYIETAKSLGLDKVEGSLRSQSGYGDEILTAPEKFKEIVFTEAFDMRYRTTAEVQKYIRKVTHREISGKRLLSGLLKMSSANYSELTDFNHAKILGAMGYDGLTSMGAGEVVAFREPFDAATDQLHEYYGGKRLQRMDADEYLGDVNDYQLTSYTDHFSSNPAAKRPWFLDSVVDRIRLTGESADERRASSIVADATSATARDADTLDGQFIQNFELVEQHHVKLSAADSEQAQIYMAHARRTDPDTGELVHPIPEETLARYNEPDSVVKHYVEWFRKQYTAARELDIDAGAKIYHPKTGELTDPGSYPEYSPEVLNQTKWRELSGNNAAKRDAAKKELSDWWKKYRVQDETHKNYISDQEIKEAVNAYVARLAGGDMAHLGSTKFGALRKAEGIGLPLTKDKQTGKFNWIEPSAANTFTSYFRRWSKDHSFFKNMEQNPDVRAILGLKDPKTGEHVPAYAKGKNPFHVETTTLADGREINKAQTSDKNIKDFIKGYLGYYEGSELFGRTANRLVVSHWLGLMSGARDLGSSYVFSLPHLRGRDMGLMLSSLGDFKRSWIQSHLYGVNKKHANRIEFATETHNKLADTANRWSDIASLVSGRTPLERITRTLQFALGRAVVLKHMGVAKGVDITVDRNMRRLGQMSGVDIAQLRRHADKADVDFKLDDKTLDDALDRMAKAWVEANQGTYDVRGVPSWTMSGSMSMFTSLARWNIEKFGTMKREIVRPAMDEGDWRPFIKATLGSVFTGTLLIELSEYINNKFRANPTLEEAIREGDEEEIAYAVADSLNYAGYFGIASALANDTIMKLGRGQRPTGAGIVFPAWDFISQSLTEPIFDAVTAIEEGEDPLPTVWDAFHQTVRNTFQTYRIMYNNDMLGLLPLGRERANEQNVRRDLRIFRRFEGIRGVAPVGGLGNRMLRPETRAFKEADTIEEAREALPKAFEEQRRRAKGRGDKLKSYTQGLYTIPDKTLPSPDTVEGAQEFMRYREYITGLRGDMYWKRIFDAWVRNREFMKPAKKLLVKSYVEHLIQSSSTSRP